MRLTSPRVRLRSLVATGSDRDHTRVSALVSVLAAGASAAIALTAADAWRAASAHPAEFATLLVFAVALQLVPVSVYGRGSMTVSGIGILATGFTFGVGPAIAIAAICGLVHAVRMRLKLHKAIFNVATLALSAGAATLAFSLLGGPHWGSAGRIAPAVFAGACYAAVNTVVVAYAMSLSESRPLLAVWRERFRWLTAHYLAFGPLALASSIAYEEIGLVGLIAFVLPPALLVLSVRQYLDRAREAVEEVRRANEDLRYANAELAERNDDLHELFQFAAGLAARAADRKALVGYAESSLGRLAGGSARIALGDEERGIELFAGGSRVGTLDVRSSSGAEKWERLREAILPQLATALESAELVERVKSTHLATIAALSRSMEAKDYYTGGHTERVSDIAIALARRLGYVDGDLDAIEIGALLHDIGKIGIPERILHKPGPLDDEEWKVMKEHPVISDYILSGVDLNPIVRQIARSSHERMDGAGYPDGLAGEEIPLPARIVLVADAFDALTSDRPYRRARHVTAALDEIRAGAGGQFCPLVVNALERVYREEPRVLTGAALHAVQVA